MRLAVIVIAALPFIISDLSLANDVVPAAGSTFSKRILPTTDTTKPSASRPTRSKDTGIKERALKHIEFLLHRAFTDFDVGAERGAIEKMLQLAQKSSEFKTIDYTKGELRFILRDGSKGKLLASEVEKLAERWRLIAYLEGTCQRKLGNTGYNQKAKEEILWVMSGNRNYKSVEIKGEELHFVLSDGYGGTISLEEQLRKDQQHEAAIRDRYRRQNEIYSQRNGGARVTQEMGDRDLKVAGQAGRICKDMVEKYGRRSPDAAMNAMNGIRALPGVMDILYSGGSSMTIEHQSGLTSVCPLE